MAYEAEISELLDLFKGAVVGQEILDVVFYPVEKKLALHLTEDRIIKFGIEDMIVSMLDN